MTPATVADRTGGAVNTTSTSHTIAKPAGVTSSQGLLVCFSNDSSAVASTTSTGWERLGTLAQGTNHTGTVFWAANAATASDLVVALSVAQRMTYRALVINNPGTPVLASTSGAATTSITMPTATPAATGDHLCVVYLATDSSAGATQSASGPSGFSNGTVQNPTTTTSAHSYTAERAYTGVSSVSPGAITTTLSEQYVAFTLLFPGVAASSGGGSSGTPTTPIIRSFSEAVSSTTSMSVAKPAGLVEQDYLLALHAGDADTTALTAAGFTSLSAQASTSATNIPRGTIWGKVATSTDVAASTFAFGCTSSATPAQSVTLMAIQKGTYDPTDVIDFGTWRVQTRGTAGTGVALQTADSMTGVNYGLLLAFFVVDANGNAQTYPATASGMDLINHAQSASGYSMHAVYDVALTADGATGAKTVTPSGTNTSNGWATILGTINPAPATADYTQFFLSAV